MNELVRIDLKPIIEEIVGSSVETVEELDLRDIQNRARANHTGTQSIDTIIDSATSVKMTPDERLKLVNSPLDTNQALSDISDLLASDDTSLDDIQEIINYIKINKEDLENLSLDNIADSVTYIKMTPAERIKLSSTEISSELDTRDTNNRSRTNHTGTQLASTISNFDTEVANNTEVTANIANRHSHANKSTLDVINQELATTSDVGFASVQLSGGTGDEGTLSWNADEGTLDLVANSTTLQIGQETYINVKNQSGSTIADGTVVMAAGTLGASGKILIAPYDGVSLPKYILGITTESIADGEDGKITTFGKIRGLDTSAWSEGDELFVTTNGGLVNTEPATGVNVAIAYVINVHASNGTIMVRFTPYDENLAYTKTESDGLLDDKQDILAEGAFVNGDKTKLNGIETGAAADQLASEVPVTANGNLSSTNVQSALIELQNDIDTINEGEW